MCKVLIIPAIKKAKIDATMKFVRAMAATMSKGNSDGLGYAAIDESGQLFGERWFLNNEAFKPVVPVAEVDYTPLKDTAGKNLAQFGKALKVFKSEGWKKGPEVQRYNSFGNGQKMTDMVALTLHTRAATCDRNLTNVHPFVDETLDTSVIHNGVITNHKEFDLKLSTCDSESILISYLNAEVNKDISNVQGMVDKLRGYYACGTFSRDADGNRILDVFKLNNNNLAISYIYELETYVLASSDTDIKEICKAIGFSHDGTQDLQDEFITRINPFTGEIVGQVTFEKPSYNAPTTSYGHNGYGPHYHGARHWNWNDREREAIDNMTKELGTNTTKFENKGKGSKVIDEAIAKMMALKSDIRELGFREVEEIAAEYGYDA